MLNSCTRWQNETVSAKDSLCRKGAFIYCCRLLTCSSVLVGKKAKVENEMPFMDRLMDVLLSLLAKASGHLPSAPLRDAAEGLFRVFAGHLTSTGDPLTWNTADACLWAFKPDTGSQFWSGFLRVTLPVLLISDKKIV